MSISAWIILGTLLVLALIVVGVRWMVAASNVPARTVAIPAEKRTDGILFALTFDIGEQRVDSVEDISGLTPLERADNEAPLRVEFGTHWLFILPCNQPIGMVEAIDRVTSAVNDEREHRKLVRLGSQTFS